jgi:hypothetical protein
MTTEADALVRRYLDLGQELHDVPTSRRRELVDEMREHIRESLAETGVLFGLALAPLVAIVYLALRLRD